MPLSLVLQTIPAAGFIVIELPTKTYITVLVINNISANNMRYHHAEGEYGDVVFAGGFKAYHVVDGDQIPDVFMITGTAADTFSVHYEEAPR